MLDAERRKEYAGLINDSGHHLLGGRSTVFSTCRRSRPTISRSRRSRSRRRRSLPACCDLLALRAREAGVELDKVVVRRSAGHDRRQARAQSDPAQSPVQRDPVHRPRRQGRRQRPRRSGEHHLRGRRQRRRHQRARICRGSANRTSRRARPTTAAMAAPVSVSPSSKGLVRLHGGELAIRSRLGEGTRVTVRMPLDCERARRDKKLSAPTASATGAHVPVRWPKGAAAPPASAALAGEDRASNVDMRVKKSA